MVKTNEEKIEEILSRGVEEVIDKDRLKKKLLSGKTLRIKLGIDPTSPNIHLGRAGALWKLRAFQELGHKVIFIVGDFTGLIGDTSDKETERPMLSQAEIKKNIKTYFAQAGKIIDPKKTEMHYNSKWLKKIGFLEIGKMADAFSLHEFESRENISRRLKAGKRVSLRELLYPIMQGYDSVMVKADVEIGGTDQRFNLLAGRVIQPLYGQSPQDILTRALMEGTDGRKMSSSWDNTINILDSPNEMFGKTMSLPDELIEKYFILATNVPIYKIEQIKTTLNQKDQKMRLAHEVVKMYHGERKAQKAEEEFSKTFRDKNPTFIEVTVDEAQIFYPELLSRFGMANSTSEAKRLIIAGAVDINGAVDKEWKKMIDIDEKGVEIKVGKRNFIRVKLH